MPVKGKRSLPINEETHKKISIESATVGRDMYLLADDAWSAYEAAKGKGQRCEQCDKVSYFGCEHAEFKVKGGLIPDNENEIISKSQELKSLLGIMGRIKQEERARFVKKLVTVAKMFMETPETPVGPDVGPSDKPPRPKRSRRRPGGVGSSR